MNDEKWELGLIRSLTGNSVAKLLPLILPFELGNAVLLGDFLQLLTGFVPLLLVHLRPMIEAGVARGV